jgi:O-antigen/teichoic acid export membrane protein
MLFKVKGVVTMPIVTHFLSPSDLGTLNLIGTASSLLVPLFCLNLIQGPAIYLVQESSKDTIRRMYNTVVNASALISLVASIALFAAVSVFGAQFLHYLPLVVLMVLSSLRILHLEMLLRQF